MLQFAFDVLNTRLRFGGYV